ncbi:HMG1/2-like protein [Hibiscus syriacus]|uniref:HMG1/2-like protein n=1 Tax=Hibiscus syriacus TaxID=106335 RepID=A0A6A3C8I6_HIBSY|nr:HMG1/2-like protein [Hibiscus syriacus]
MKGGKSKSDTKRAKLSVSEKSTKKAGKKLGKAAQDPNKPKRPASAFFVFMEEFREKYKKEHPKNKSVAAVGKGGGDKWKSLSEAAKKRKVEYEKNMKSYSKRQAECLKNEDVESEKSVSEVNDKEEDDDEGSGDEDDD